MRPTGAPLLTGVMVTVTTSPGLNDVRRYPAPVILVGLPVSRFQFLTEPESSLASSFKKQCGFAHSHSVSVPFNVTVFSLSKLAAPGCATTNAGNMKQAAAA